MTAGPRTGNAAAAVDQPEGSARKRHGRALAPLTVIFLCAGLATALIGPFLTLFLTSVIHSAPWQISLFLVAQPVCGIAGSTVLGRLSDGRIARRHTLLLSAAGGLAASLVFAGVRDYWLLLALVCTLNAVGGALLPQAFGYARAVLAGDPSAAMVNSTLRMFFSLAWVAGPPLASLLLATGSFVWLYVSAAILYAVVIGVVGLWLAEPSRKPPSTGATPAGAREPTDAGRRALWLTVAGFAVTQSALIANVQALPLHITKDLRGHVSQAGLILGLCAALEIPLMLGFGWLSTRVPLWKLVRLGPLFGLVYFTLMATAGQVWQLAAAQLLNAAFIAVIAGLGISYVQDLLPTQPGRASTLYSNAFPIGAMLASPVMGLGASIGYRTPYVAAIGLTSVGWVLLSVGARSHRTDLRSARTTTTV